VVVGIGLLLGIAGSLVAARAFAGLLFGVGPADPVALCGALAILAAVAAVATLVPALRAAKVDPVVALRAE
jgi:ABC-type antimicrobial peptide transport system permease subunit